MYTYEEHYHACREVYDKNNENSKYSSLYDLIADLELFEKNDEYMRIINGLATKVSDRMDKNEGCRRDPHALRLKQALDIPEISEFAELVMPTIEEQVLQSNATIETVHIYRSIPDEGGYMEVGSSPEDRLWVPQAPTDSWLWHYDDCPREFLKLMVYLNDVDKKSGCFRLLVEEDGTMPVIETFRKSPYRPHGDRPQSYPKSRIPWQVTSEMMENGAQVVDVVGPAGTAALITPNIYHRATIPSADCENPRDVMFFFIRPCLEKREGYINESTTTFETARNVKNYTLD